MLSLVKGNVEVDAPAARAIALAMREVARADGEHPREEELIDSFEEGLEGDAAPLSDIVDPGVREVFLKSLIIVAVADGTVSDEESAVIRKYADHFGLGDPEISRCLADVASAMLSQLAGVQVFREQVVELGRGLGLDEFAIRAALDS